MAIQQTIDFDRGEQLAALRMAEMRPQEIAEGQSIKRVSVATQKAVLRAIDELAGYQRGRVSECWASVATIARISGVSERHVARALKVLLAQSLLTCEAGSEIGPKTRTNHYRIVWNELSLLVKPKESRAEAKPAPVSAANAVTATEAKTVGTMATKAVLIRQETEFQTASCGGNDTALGAEKSALGASKSALGAGKSALGAYYPPISANIRPHPPEGEAGSFGISSPRQGAGQSAVANTRDPVAEEFRGTGLAYWKQLADEFRGHGLDAIRSAIATYRANAKALRGPGSIVAYLRTGRWPSDEIANPEVESLKQARAAAAREQRRREYAAGSLIRQLRGLRWSDEQIEAELEKRGLEWH